MIILFMLFIIITICFISLILTNNFFTAGNINTLKRKAYKHKKLLKNTVQPLKTKKVFKSKPKGK